MARTIVITIEDNDKAEEFARGMLSGAFKHWMPSLSQGMTIDLMIARPTKACSGKGRCKGERTGPRIIKPWTRTPRFGWFVCASCKRPAPAVVKNFIKNMAGGHRDLLPELDSSREPNGPAYDEATYRTVHQYQRRAVA